MSNNASLEKAIEIFVLITLPVALVVGCEGTLKQRAEVDKTDEIRAVEQSYNMNDLYPLFSNDSGSLAVNEILQTVAEEKKDEQPLIIADVKQEAKEETVPAGRIQRTELMHVSFAEPVKQETMSNTEPESNTLPVANSGINTADNSEDVFAAGANSTMAYTGRVELQPSYMVFRFDTDTASVQEYEYYFLKQHAAFLENNPNLLLVVGGHTDSKGSRIYNEELSRQRADEVIRLLVGFGAPESQLQLKAHGESMPILGAEDKDNRRVELKYMDNTLVSAK